MNRNMRRSSNSVGLRIGRKFLFLLMMVGIPAFILLTSFNLETVEVVGAKEYTSEQIKAQVITSSWEQNALYLYLKYEFFSAPRLPFVEKLNVEMNGNHGITIYVYEKMVAGCVEFMGEYLYFDKDGIVVESSSKKLDHIPEIKGLKFSEIILNEKLKVQNVVMNSQDEDTEQDSKLSEKQRLQKQQEEQQKKEQDEKQRNEKLFLTIINLMQLIDKYELKIDTINFNLKDEVTIDSDGVRFLLGKKSTYDEEFSEIKGILEKANGMNITIDMRNYVKGMENIIAKPKKTTE